MSAMTNKLVAELKGAQLDWAVAKAEGRCLHERTEYYAHQSDTGFTCLDCGKDTYHEVCWRDWKPSSSWSQGSPIIERERITIDPIEDNQWAAHIVSSSIKDGWLRVAGASPLIAAMRAFVASKMGDEVEVPA